MQNISEIEGLSSDVLSSIQNEVVAWDPLRMRPAFDVRRADDGVSATGHESRVADAHTVTYFRCKNVCQVALETEGEATDAEVAARKDDVMEEVGLRFRVEVLDGTSDHRRQRQPLVHFLHW